MCVIIWASRGFVDIARPAVADFSACLCMWARSFWLSGRCSHPLVTGDIVISTDSVIAEASYPPSGSPSSSALAVSWDPNLVFNTFKQHSSLKSRFLVSKSFFNDMLIFWVYTYAIGSVFVVFLLLFKNAQMDYAYKSLTVCSDVWSQNLKQKLIRNIY